MPVGMRVKGRLCVFGRLEPAAAAELSCRDLAALAALLGDNTFFHGAAPGTLDCAVFGHLAQFLYIDIDFPQKKYLKENANTPWPGCQNLLVRRSQCRRSGLGSPKKT